MINKGKLSSEDKAIIKLTLDRTPNISDEEMRRFSSKHPYVVDPFEGVDIIDCTKKYYSTENELFNDYLVRKFGKPDWVVDTFYKLSYSKGDRSLPHKDVKSSTQTTILILEGAIEGGETIIEGIDRGLYSNGDYINFNGHDNLHEVKEVITGKREALIIWFNTKKQLL